MQAGLLEALVDIVKVLGPKAVDASSGARSFTSFAMALIKIKERRHTVIQWKCEADEACTVCILRFPCLLIFSLLFRNAISKIKMLSC